MSTRIIALVLACLFGAHDQTARANIIVTLTEGVGGVVNMNISAEGTVDASDSVLPPWFFVIGDPSRDSFLPAEFAGITGSPPAGLSLDGCPANNFFYRDDSTSFSPSNLQSLLGFNLAGPVSPVAECETGLMGELDLSDLNGDYVLPGSSFADFVPGSYTGLSESNGLRVLQNLPPVSLIVAESSSVPTPATVGLFAIGIFGASLAARRRGSAMIG
ncbi:MAG: hypothetical protein RLO18_24940 [Gimesia chilikensis]|uniref:hypothetical protein n=1 Tax=Pseudohaliea sp. TaxID=2740289 RepID=UPI0032ED5198